MYALFYNLCMSEEGLQHLKKYFSANDTSVFDPIFIAQYLLAPVNTIIDKNELRTWMMTPYPLPDGAQSSKKLNARKVKTELYLKYVLLVDLMQVVATYGRTPEYNFDTDEKLAAIVKGKHSDQKCTKKPKSYRPLMVSPLFGC